jgi:hypothetical protein
MNTKHNQNMQSHLHSSSSKDEIVFNKAFQNADLSTNMLITDTNSGEECLFPDMDSEDEDDMPVTELSLYGMPVNV